MNAKDLRRGATIEMKGRDQPVLRISAIAPRRKTGCGFAAGLQNLKGIELKPVCRTT